MALFDGYLAPRQFGEGGGLLGRLLALQQQQSQYQPGPGFAASAPAPQTAQAMPWANLPGDESSFDEQSGAPNLNSQYRALRSVLGDHHAMLATVDPNARKVLVAQALSGHQGFYGGDNSPGDEAPVLSDASPDPIRPGSQYAQGALAACGLGPIPCAAGVGITAGQAILAGGALGGLGALILKNRKAQESGSDPEKGLAGSDLPSTTSDETLPVKNPPDCAAEIADALKECTAAAEDNWTGKYRQGPWKAPSVDSWSIPDCMRGRISEICGGNRVDKTGKPRKVKRYKIR